MLLPLVMPGAPAPELFDDVSDVDGEGGPWMASRDAGVDTGVEEGDPAELSTWSLPLEPSRIRFWGEEASSVVRVVSTVLLIFLGSWLFLLFLLVGEELGDEDPTSGSRLPTLTGVLMRTSLGILTGI